MSGIKILPLDIETAPNICYAWGAKTRYIPATNVVTHGYTMCWAARWMDSKDVTFRSIHHDDQGTMIRDMWELLDVADAVMTYNGKRFDAPRLNAEFMKLKLPPPSPYKHIDLLQTVRKQVLLMHHGLDPVAKFLDLGEKIEHKGMDLWKGCMAGNDEDWEIMKEYNIQDVNLLVDVYHELLPWIEDHPNVALYRDDAGEQMRCKNCGSLAVKKNGVEHTTVLTYQRYRCTNCGTNMKGRYSIAGRGNANILRAA